MGRSSRPNLKRLLPAVVVATFYVAVAPALVVWELGAVGILSSPVLSVLGVLVLSLAASWAGAAWWKRRPHSEDVLFGDLILWSWIRRWRLERRLDEARTVLAGTPPRQVSPVRRARLLQSLASALEDRDPYTHGHSRRVARFSVLIARRMGLPSEMVAKVRTAAAVHDVGKINVPVAVLNKPGRLTDEEFAQVKRHATDSARLVRDLDDEQITAIVRHHHERLDGTGYPDGLAGEDVPLGSRIIAVADTFDALTSRRPYRPPNSHETAMATLASEAGTQLDPDAVRAFRSCYSGRRGLTVWNGAALIPERLISALSAGLGSGGTTATAQLLSTAAATTVLGAGVVLSTSPVTSAAQQASRRAATVIVDASVPGVRSGSLVSVPALHMNDSSLQGADTSPDAGAGPGADAKPPARTDARRGGRPAAASGSGTRGADAAGPGSGDGSRTASGRGPLPRLPADGGSLVPKLPDAGVLPPAPSDGGRPPDVGVPGGGGLLPSLPVPGHLTDRPPSPGAVVEGLG